MMNLLWVTLNTLSMQASQCCVWASKKKKKKFKNRKQVQGAVKSDKY